MNPNKAGLVLVALAAQWVLADAPRSAVARTPLTHANSSDATPKPPAGTASPNGGRRPETAATRIGLVALSP